MADTLEQDVHALKEWLSRAWHYLADSSMTRFERRELRNYMREAEVALRAGLQRLAVRDKTRREAYAYPARQLPDFRVLNVGSAQAGSLLNGHVVKPL